MFREIFIIAAAVFFFLAAIKVPAAIDWMNAAFCCLVIGLLLV
jgi:hypothetical protein